MLWYVVLLMKVSLMFQRAVYRLFLYSSQIKFKFSDEYWILSLDSSVVSRHMLTDSMVLFSSTE